MQYNILFQNTFVTPQTPFEIGLNDVKKKFTFNFQKCLIEYFELLLLDNNRKRLLDLVR